MNLPRFAAPILALVLLLLPSGCNTTRLTPEERERQMEIHLEACSGWLAMSEWKRAEDQALRGLALEPDNFLLRLYLARALLNLGSTQQILRAEHVLLELEDEGDFRVPLTMGEVKERKGIAFAEAAAAVRTGERFTEAPDPESRAAELERQARDTYLEALSRYRAAFELQPNDTEVLNGLVRTTCLLGDYTDSLAWGDAIIRITASDRLFWKEQLVRPDISDREEKRIWDSIKKLNDLEVAVHLQAATTLNNYLDDPSGALAHLDAIIAFDPDIAETHSQRAQLLVKLGRPEEAIAAIDRYLRLAGLEFTHPDIQRAYRSRTDCEAALARQGE